MTETKQQIITRIQRKMRLVKFLNRFMGRLWSKRIALFISRHFSWVFGPLNKYSPSKTEFTDD